ncbi:uncharacterized protein MYCFIDRAFT_178180 [Pseudocercospora fijiensis CIRAD86]|uniref:Uncharacterized protein n=1 Tax=Pseudocercospora fijiensis (strain CIRAD86) TaxID=383855 RepID=M3AR71_PSEFD|nr:uncharacterized protein MYCFIDRAFT_178180 [Pseudocercospora fijiensis CIRAD86]EME79593.1 hypothetical protein MYCFIDRAFT_178180 [Pseudocercospora fijiensis CIRAD86]
MFPIQIDLLCHELEPAGEALKRCLPDHKPAFTGIGVSNRGEGGRQRVRSGIEMGMMLKQGMKVRG